VEQVQDLDAAASGPATVVGAPLREHLRGTIRLGLPLVLAQMALMGQGVIDALLAGRLDARILASVAIGVAMWGFLMVLNFGVQAALSPTLAQLRGAGRLHELKGAARQAIWTALLVMAVMFLLAHMAPWVLSLFNVDPVLRPGALDFMSGVTWGIPGLVCFSLLRCYCRWAPTAPGWRPPSCSRCRRWHSGATSSAIRSWARTTCSWGWTGRTDRRSAPC
jgi:Na+-driven multidrug efflux pump